MVKKDITEEQKWTTEELFNVDPNCDHEIEDKWSGVGCKKHVEYSNLSEELFEL